MNLALTDHPQSAILSPVAHSPSPDQGLMTDQNEKDDESEEEEEEEEEGEENDDDDEKGQGQGQGRTKLLCLVSH